MKRITSLLCASLLLLFLAVSCKKENPVNQVPKANAGDSRTITLYADSVTLTGSGTDADGQVVAYLWSQVSGPAATTIINPGSASTKIKGFKAGTYVFQLMVTDDMGATGVDTCMVTVNPAPITTLTLQPANNPNQVIMTNLNGAFSTGTGADFPIAAWTTGGLPVTIRGAIKFDLSSIPAGAIITSANLYLYSYPPPTLNGNFTDANFGSDNTMVIQQFTSAWSPGTIGWNNLPTTTTSNQVIVPHTAQSQLDLNLDVKGMISSMVSSNANYGFYFKIQTENYYNSRIFVSSWSTATLSAKYPKLVVVYH